LRAFGLNHEVDVDNVSQGCSALCQRLRSLRLVSFFPLPHDPTRFPHCVHGPSQVKTTSLLGWTLTAHKDRPSLLFVSYVPLFFFFLFVLDLSLSIPVFRLLPQPVCYRTSPHLPHPHRLCAHCRALRVVVSTISRQSSPNLFLYVISLSPLCQALRLPFRFSIFWDRPSWLY
jgi:hypothetical protein